MYVPIPSQRTCAQAWLAAAIAINQIGREAYNVIVDIEEPSARTPADEHIISLVDDFLRAHNSPEKTVYPVSSVANTIFPYALFRRHGAPKFYDVYLRVYDHSKKPQDWGRYFHRMIYYKTPDGEVINPLAMLVEKIRNQVQASRTFKSVYELAVFDPICDLSTYDPVRDAGRVMNRQCLSFLSFKLHPERGLMLTVMYRNHYYIARGLGNFIGLTHLQEFIAQEAGVPVGPLTCVSTHAEIDRHPWKAYEVDALLHACDGALLNRDGVEEALVSRATL
jgi:hypothetical protein